MALQSLIGMSEVEIRAVVTLRASRYNADFADVAGVAQAAGIPVHYADDMDPEALQKALEGHAADLGFVIGWSRLLPRAVIDSTALGFVGYHPAALPCNRGRHPIIWTIALGLDEAASTFFMIDEGQDSGPIVSQQPVPVAPRETAATLYAKLLDLIPGQLAEIVTGLDRGTLVPAPQDDSRASYWRKRGRADGAIDWRMSATTIDRLVRSLSAPYPGAEFVHDGETVTLWKCAVLDEGPANAEPGKVVAMRGTCPVVKAGEGCVILEEMTPVREISVGDYL